MIGSTHMIVSESEDNLVSTSSDMVHYEPIFIIEENVDEEGVFEMDSDLKELKDKEDKMVQENKDLTLETIDCFLSSSLSTELVYIILHGICQFTLLNFIKGELTEEQTERFQKLVFSVDEHGDIQIKIRPFKIEHAHEWEENV